MPLDGSEKAAAQIVPFLNAKNRSEKFLLFLLLLRLKCSKGRNVHGLLVASYLGRLQGRNCNLLGKIGICKFIIFSTRHLCLHSKWPTIY